MSSPVCGGTPPQNILHVQSCAALDEKADQVGMACTGSLVQRRRMGVTTDRVVTVWIFGHGQYQASDLDMTKLRCQGERQMAVVGTRPWKQSAKVRDTSQGGRYWKIDPCAAPEQNLHGFHFAVQRCCVDRAVGVGSVIAEKVDQWKLHAAFTRHAARGDEHERLVKRRLLRAGVENHFAYLDNVRWEFAAANRIFGNELQQRGTGKVVPALESDVLMHHLRMLFQINAQTCDVACINKVDGVAKNRVFDSFMVRQIQLIRQCRFFNMPFESCPAGKSRLTGDGELRVTEL